MKVLMANKYFYLKGGAENSFFETANLLKKKGHQVSFFSMKGERNLPSEYEEYFIPEVRYESGAFSNRIAAAGRMLYSFSARRNIEKLMRKEKPDIAHLNNIYHQISPSILHSLKKFKVPVVMTLRDYKVVCASYSMVAGGKICEACKDGKYYQTFLKACVKDSRLKSLLNTLEMYLHHHVLNLYGLVDVFISPSAFLKQKVVEMGFRGRVVHLPNFTTLDDYEPVYEYEPSVIYFGRISKEKGIATLIEGVRGTPVQLKIVGEGPLKETLSRSLKPEDNVKFLGYKTGDDLRNEIKKSMCVMLPSEWYENNPRTVLEAFAFGKPAIGSRVGGIPELVRDNETGLTYEMGNAADLKEKLLYFIRHPEEVRRMGVNARKMVENELNREVHYKKLMEVYKSVMS